MKNIRFLSDDIALVHLHGRPQIPGQAVPAPEQYSIQTLIGIRRVDGWRFTSFQNTLLQQEWIWDGSVSPSEQKGTQAMYARVTLAQLQPDKGDELLQFLRDHVVPAAQAQQGFKGLLLLTDENANKGIAIALWETEAVPRFVVFRLDVGPMGTL